MILERTEVSPEEFERKTGWAITPAGACKAGSCVPLPRRNTPQLDVALLAKYLDMPLLHEEGLGVFCLGPESQGKVLATAAAPELTLPDWHGQAFRLSSLRGTKVLLLAWASW